MNQFIPLEEIIQKFKSLVEKSLNDQCVKEFNEILKNLDFKDMTKILSFSYLIEKVIDLDSTSFMKKIYPKLTDIIRKNLEPHEFTELVYNMLDKEIFFVEILNQKFKPLVEKTLNDQILYEIKEILKNLDLKDSSKISSFRSTIEKVIKIAPTSFMDELTPKLTEMIKKKLDPPEFQVLKSYMSENTSFLEDIVNQKFKLLVEKALNAQIIKKFKEILKNLDFKDSSKISDYSISVEEVFKLDRDFFIQKVYPKFLEMIRKILEPNELNELEKYIIKNTSFLEEIVNIKFKLLVENKLDSQIVMLFQEILKNQDNQFISSLSFSDLVEKVSQLEPKFFMKKVYPNFLEMIRKILDPHKLRELKNYLFENTNFLEVNVNQKFTPLMKEKKYYQIVKEFKEILISLDFENYSEMLYFSDLAERVFKIDSTPFMDEVYPKFIKMLRKNLKTNELKEIEKYMIENTSFLEYIKDYEFKPIVKIDKSIDQLVEAFEEILKKPDFQFLSSLSFSVLVEKVFKLDRAFFMKSVYPKFLEMIRKTLDPHELKEFENYMIKNTSYLKVFVKKIFKPLVKKKNDQIIEQFQGILKNLDTQLISSLSFSSLVEKVSNLDSDFFMKSVYPKFLEMIRKTLDPRELKELEKYMLENTSFLEVTTYQKFKPLVEKKQNDQIVTQFKKTLKNLDADAISEMSSFNVLVEEVFKINPTFFMQKVYPNFRKMIRNYLDPDKLKELEKYILKNTSFSNQEKIIFDFKGEFIQKIENTGTKIGLVDAHIYFTNIRIIIHSNGIQVGPVDAQIRSYFGNGYMKKYYESMIINRNFYHSKPCFGYEFPIIALHDIEKTKSHVKYYFHQGGKNYFCEIYPKFVFSLRGIEKILNKLNTEDLSNKNEGVQCRKCERLIKSNHQFCKYCGQKLTIGVS